MKNTKKQAVTIYDVAKEADVSLATVSRVLNSSAVVRPERKKRVEEAIARLNFKPNEIARGLARKTSTSIGVIVSDINRSSVSELLAGIIDTANLKQYAYSVAINSYMGDVQEFNKQIEHMISSQVDGLLVMCDYITEEMYQILKSAAVPIVLFATQNKHRDIYTISINYRQVAHDVSSYFFKQAYKKLLVLSRNLEDTDEMVCEFQTLSNHHKVETEVMKLKEDYAKNYAYFHHYYQENALPEGVFATSDSIALAFSNAIQDLGYNIPNDVEVISFSNTQSAIMARPQLTSVMYPIYRIGAYAMSAITKLIKNEVIEEINLENDYQIIWRQSTKK